MSEIDLPALRARLAVPIDARFPGATLGDLRRLPGGVSSLTYAAGLDGDVPAEHRTIVLKVAPPGLKPVRNRDVLRQARVMRVLGTVDDVRVPEILFAQDGDPPLFAMAFVPGQSYEPLTDVVADPPTAAVVTERAHAAARMLARLQDVVPADAGLADEPVVPLREELDRWAALFATCPDELRHDEQALHALLTEAIPEAIPSRILHGDYRLANMQFAGADLRAIIDWEIWSVGDPRTDLAWLLMHTDPQHRFDGDPDAANVAAGTGMPSRDELLTTYLADRPIATEELAWFLAYCHYKCASTIAVLAKQARRRGTSGERMERAASTLPVILARGHEHVRAAQIVG